MSIQLGVATVQAQRTLTNDFHNLTFFVIFWGSSGIIIISLYIFVGGLSIDMEAKPITLEELKQQVEV